MQRKVLFVIGLFGTLVFPSFGHAQTHCLEEDDHHSSGENVMHLWTGPQAGYYYQVGKAIAAASKHMPDEIRIHSCSSNGSATNIDGLLKNQADFAIVQSDVAHALWHCEVQDPQKCERQKEFGRVRLVTPLFVEKAQVLVRPHLYVSSLADLRSRCIWVGSNGSGSEPTARMLLEAAGWSREQIDDMKSHCPAHPKDLDEALALLRKGDQLDAIIQTRVAPSRPIYQALKTSEIQLLGIDWNTVQRMTQDGVYRETSIQPSEYPSAGEGIYSIGVQALLVTRNNTDADAVRAMSELISGEQADIENHLRRNLLAEGGAKGDTDSDTAAMVDGELIGPTTLMLVGSKVSDSFVPFVDPEAKPTLWSWSVRRGTFIWLVILLAVLAAIGMFLKLHARGRKVVSGYYREVLFLFGGVVAWTFASLWLQAMEGDLNEHFTTLWSAAFALGQNVLAKLPLQIFSAPTPTTRNGTALVSGFTYLSVSVATIYLLPWIKKSWPRLWPTFWGKEMQGSEKAEAEPKQLTPAPSSNQPEATAEEQEVLRRAAGA